MAYSEKFPKQKVIRRKPVVLASDKFRNTTDRKIFDLGAKKVKHRSRMRK